MPQPKMRKLGKLTPLTLTPDQVTKAYDHGRIKKTDGGYQKTFREITDSIKTATGVPTAHVYDVTLDKMKEYASRTDGGSYQQWCRDVLKANGIAWL